MLYQLRFLTWHKPTSSVKTYCFISDVISQHEPAYDITSVGTHRLLYVMLSCFLPVSVKMPFKTRSIHNMVMRPNFVWS